MRRTEMIQEKANIASLISTCFFFFQLLNRYKIIQKTICSYVLFVLYIFFGDTGVWTQGLVPAKQGLYHLRHASSSLCFSYFSTRVSLLLNQAHPQTAIFLPAASHIARITAVCHHTQFICWHRDSLFFCQGWPQTIILQIKSWVAGSYCVQLFGL
jgi:hypothetical protein